MINRSLTIAVFAVLFAVSGTASASFLKHAPMPHGDRKESAEILEAKSKIAQRTKMVQGIKEVLKSIKQVKEMSAISNVQLAQSINARLNCAGELLDQLEPYRNMAKEIQDLETMLQETKSQLQKKTYYTLGTTQKLFDETERMAFAYHEKFQRTLDKAQQDLQKLTHDASINTQPAHTQQIARSAPAGSAQPAAYAAHTVPIAKNQTRVPVRAQTEQFKPAARPKPASAAIDRKSNAESRPNAQNIYPTGAAIQAAVHPDAQRFLAVANSGKALKMFTDTKTTQAPFQKAAKEPALMKTQASNTKAPVAPKAAAGSAAKAQPALKTCAICTDPKNLITLSCSHSLACRECFNSMLDFALKDKNTRHLRCPDTKCKAELQSGDVRAIAPLKLTQWNALKEKQRLENDPNTRYCQNPQCSHPYTLPTKSQGIARKAHNARVNPTSAIAAGNSRVHIAWAAKTIGANAAPNKWINCLKCKKPIYCAECLLPHSNAVSCKEAQVNSELGKDTIKADKDTKKLLEETTKQCPKCKYSIEKNEGCNHMTCSKCNHDFCWLCLGIWNVNALNPHPNCPFASSDEEDNWEWESDGGADWEDESENDWAPFTLTVTEIGQGVPQGHANHARMMRHIQQSWGRFFNHNDGPISIRILRNMWEARQGSRSQSMSTADGSDYWVNI